MIGENDDYANKTYETRSFLSKWLPTIVLGSALIGFISLAWYAYDAGRQSVKEEDLLVVEAEKTPVKEKPLDPGGMQFPNQDKTIFETFSNNGQTPKVERVLPAPEEPITQRMESFETVTSGNDQSEKQEAASGHKTDGQAVEEVTLNAAPSAGKTAEEKPVEVKKVEVAGADSKKASKSAEKPAAKKDGAKIQLGAYSSEKEARETWAKVQKKFPALSGKSPIVARADIKGKVFYRLRVSGFASSGEAKKLCSTLSSKGQPCILPKG